MKLSAEQLKAFDEQGYVFFPNCFSEEEIALLALGSGKHPQARPPGSLAREIRRAAHRLCRAQVQQSVRGHVAPSAAGRAADAAVRRERLRPPVQAQRQGGLRRRRLAVAPGLRHLGARRRHARTARDEHRDFPGRGAADQRRADDHSEEPQAGRARRRPRQDDDIISAMDTGQGDRDPARAGSRRPGRRRHRRADRQSRARC